MRSAGALLVALLLCVPSVAALGLHHETQGALDGDQAACAPPCGTISPRLLFEMPQLTREPINASAGDTLTFQGTLTFWADTDDEGYVPPDPQEPITIRFSFPRTPPWASMSVEPNQLDVQSPCPTCTEAQADDPAQPTFHYAQRFNITLTVELLEAPEQTPGYDYGKLQLFAKSTESGIWQPGYGIKEVRIQAGADEALEQNSNVLGAPGPGLAGVAVALTSAATVAWLRRE